MGAEPMQAMTQAEFLAWELTQTEKHEYVDGFVTPRHGDRTLLAQAGASAAHNRIAVELTILIGPLVRPCYLYNSDMKVETVRSTRYPDLAVTCDDRDRGDAYVVRHPRLLIEVLSESTAREDLGEKMREYQTIDMLVDYAMIDSRKRWAQVLHRGDTGWHLSTPQTAGVLHLASFGIDVDLDTLYERAGVPRS